MSIFGIVLLLIVCGVGLWAINAFIPMQAGIKKLLNVFVVIVLVLVILYAFGVFAYLEQFRTPVPRLRR
jgi:hypothetical protein